MPEHQLQMRDYSSVAAIYEGMKVSPRVRKAAMLYASGVAATKKEAAAIAGITPVHLQNMTSHNPEVRRIMNDVQVLIDDETVATSKILQTLSRKAVGRLAELMDSANETVAFRAAQDLADRGPETQKTQRVQVDALTLTGEDAKAIAAAMVESSKARETYADVAVHGFVDVDIDAKPALRLVPGSAES